MTSETFYMAKGRAGLEEYRKSSRTPTEARRGEGQSLAIVLTVLLMGVPYFFFVDAAIASIC